MPTYRDQLTRPRYHCIVQENDNGVKVRFGPDELLRMRDAHPKFYNYKNYLLIMVVQFERAPDSISVAAQ